MNTGIIYSITSPNGKSYIGQTMDFENRMKRHQDRTSRCVAISSAIGKYGWDNMEVELLHENVPIDDLNWLERHCIWIYGTMSPDGYNLTDGGEGGIQSEESRAKQGATQREKALRGEHQSQRPEVRKQIADTLKLMIERGEIIPPMCRPEWQAEQGANQREKALRGEHQSQRPEFRAKVAATLIEMAERRELPVQQPEIIKKIQKIKAHNRRERREQAGQTYLLDEEI